MTAVAAGINLAKHAFAVRGVDEAGRAALLRPSVARDERVASIATLPPCPIVTEACPGTRHWARLFMGHGHTGLTAAARLDRAASSNRREPH